jgi:hypothetical protein
MNARQAQCQNPVERIMREFYSGRIAVDQVFGLLLMLGLPSDEDQLGKWFPKPPVPTSPDADRQSH